MSKFLLVFAFALVGCSIDQTVTPLRPSKESSIVGGSPIEKSSPSFSWSVAVRAIKEGKDGKTIGLCTGAFIGEDIVITAAHCVDESGVTYEVALGADATLLGTTAMPVEKIIIHENYRKPVTQENHVEDDIAILKIAGVRPSQVKVLNLLGEALYGDMPILALGYGRTHWSHQKNLSTDTKTGILRSVVLQAADVDPFKNHFYVDQSSGRGVCSGDSGGPAVVLANEEPYIIGIAKAVAFSPEQHRRFKEQDPTIDLCKTKSIYLNIQYYFPWIFKKLDLL